MSRKLKIILTLSVFANVLLLGITGGMVYKQIKRFGPPTEIAELSPSSRNIVARTFQSARVDMKENYKASKKARRDVVKLLRAETLDEAAYEDAVKTLKAAQGKMMDRKMEMLKSLSAELPTEDRAKISERFIRPHGPRHKGRDHKAHSKLMEK